MKILLGDFNTKVGKKNIFRPTIGDESYKKSRQNYNPQGNYKNSTRRSQYISTNRAFISKWAVK
jgi:hypothetical protein